MEQHHDELKKAGLQVIVIGLGEPKHAQRYCGSLAPSLTCWTDNTLEARFIYGLDRLKPQDLMSMDYVKSTAKAILSGHMQGKATGDTQMLPGTFIVDVSGIIRYTHYSQHPGDEPQFADLIKVAHTLA